MQKLRLICWLLLAASPFVVGQQPSSANSPAPTILPPVPAPDQLALLKSSDPKIARNKQFVYDFWRIVYEGGHMERAPEFMTERYIQHNPNVGSGRDLFVKTIGASRPPREVKPTSTFPIINIVAEGNMVVVMWARKVRDREHPEQTYDMTWFDTFRLDDKSGKIDEHWDSSERWGASGKPPGAEFFP